MIALACMAATCAEAAGMKYPENVDEWDSEENRNKYPHFFVFCSLQLGAPMPHPSAHFENAELIAKIDVEKLKTMTPEDFEEAGFQVGFSR